MPVMIINGCDFFPDSWGKLTWKACCDAHDYAYSIGGSLADKLDADRTLSICVNAVTGMGVGGIMGMGVVVFGGLFYNWKGLGYKNVVTVLKEKLSAPRPKKRS